MATLLGNRALLLLSAFHVAHARYSECKKCLFFNVLVRDSFASIIGLHARSTIERKWSSVFLCRFKSSNFDENRFPPVFKNNFIRPPVSKLLGN